MLEMIWSSYQGFSLVPDVGDKITGVQYYRSLALNCTGDISCKEDGSAKK